MRRASRCRRPGRIAIAAGFPPRCLDEIQQDCGRSTASGTAGLRGIMKTFGTTIPLARPRNAPPHASVTLQNAHFEEKPQAKPQLPQFDPLWLGLHALHPAGAT